MESNRRKLLKGSVAAPMVFTLGPAMAQVPMSSGVCLQQSQVSMQRAGGAVVTNVDQWVRMSRPVLRLFRTTGSQTPVQLEGFYIRSFDNTFYYKVELDNPTAIPQPSGIAVGEPGVTQRIVRSGHILVRLQKSDPNSPAEIVGFAWENQGLGAIASFACAVSAGLNQAGAPRGFGTG